MRSMCALLAFATTTAANQYDVVMPRCECRCRVLCGQLSWLGPLL